MILIGTMAAKLQGHLPEWREGRVGDIDLVGSRDDMNWIVAATSGLAIESPTTGFFWIICRDVPRIDFDIRASRRDELLEKLPDHGELSLYGVPVRAISPTTQYVLKRCCRHFLRRDKHERDITHFQPMARLTEPHLELFRAARIEARDFFSGR